MRPASLKTQVSAGGVIFRRNKELIEIAMVSTKNGAVWCLPKGLIDRGEKPEETAVREVKEETGLNGKIIEKLGEITYWYYLKEENVKCKKTVHFFLMEFMCGDISEHDWEVDTVSWFPLDEAIKKATYKGEREILKKAKTKINSILKI